MSPQGDPEVQLRPQSFLKYMNHIKHQVSVDVKIYVTLFMPL